MTAEYEHPHNTKVISCDDFQSYNEFLRLHGMGEGYNTGAKGIRYTDGTQLIVIFPQFYTHVGILENQLQAIIVHELKELELSGKDNHFQATICEYQYILDHCGPEALLQYHAQLRTVLWGNNDERQTALDTVLN